MDVIAAVSGYVTKAVASAAGMKVLLMDTDTTPVVSTVCTQSFLLAREVYLVDRLEKRERERMAHLKCVCFVRPSAESVALLVEELRAPKYGAYYLYFSNALKKMQIEQLAEADECELVAEVQEVFADYRALNKNLFSLGMQAPQWRLCSDALGAWDSGALQRTVEGLAAVMLSLKRRPIIRHAAGSSLCRRLAQELQFFCSQVEPSLFDTAKNIEADAVLLLLDRQADAVTPLLTPWTYQAMVHELLGIENALVDLSHVPGIRDDIRQIVLNHDDPFYATNMHQSFGDLGCAIKAYLQEYQQRTQVTSTIESLDDMKRFVDAYPEFRRLAGNVTKHVALTSELSRVVDAYRLLVVSEIEQNICCSDRDQMENVQTALANPDLTPDSKAKLVLLYALRSTRASQTVQLRRLLEQHTRPFYGELVDAVVRYAGDKSAMAGVALGSNQSASAGNTNMISRIDKQTLVHFGKSVMRGVKGVENVYTQYTPPLCAILEQLARGKLREAEYPTQEGARGASGPVQDVVVFMVGGTTYEEARFARCSQQQQQQHSELGVAAVAGMRVVVGGHTVHSSQSFLQQVFAAREQRLFV